MKLEKLLGIPRAARTIHLVINIQEPVAPPTTPVPPPKVTFWARIWGVLKVAGPASVATAAIIISILSLREQGSANLDQQLANKAVVGSTENRDAEQVSFLQSATSKPPFTSLVVDNLATTPVYSVVFQIGVVVRTGANSGIKTLSFLLNDIPGCSSGSVDIVPVVKVMRKMWPEASQVRPGAAEIIVGPMYFTDSNGLDWQYFGPGGLSRATSRPFVTFAPAYFMQATYKAASGCL